MAIRKYFWVLVSVLGAAGFIALLAYAFHLQDTQPGAAMATQAVSGDTASQMAAAAAKVTTCYIGPDGLFSLELPPGWYLSSGGTQIIRNYTPDQIQSGNILPVNGLGIQVQLGALGPDQTTEQWVNKWSEQVKAKPSQYKLGDLDAFQFDLSKSDSKSIVVVVPLKEAKFVIFGLSPADSPALKEGFSILSTILGTSSCIN